MCDIQGIADYNAFTPPACEAQPETSSSMPEKCIFDSQPRHCVFGKQSSGELNISYLQPPRAQSFKPISNYSRPTAPMETETIYKKSYFPIDACGLQQARVEPILRQDNIEKTCAKLDDKTVMSLSYMGHCGVKPPAAIIPMSQSLLGQGIMSTETTQKHDYVPKPTVRVAPTVPPENITRTCAPLEKDTIFRLSYMPIDLSQNPPPKPIKPLDEYQKPPVSTENCTVYKMSYQPVCPPAREDYPWARKVSHSNPFASVEKDTIYKLSYMGNSGLNKSEPFLPVSCLKLFDGAPSYSTIYKASYMPTSTERPTAIRPCPSILRPEAPIEKDTVYKLSYAGHCNSAPPSLIVPPPSRLRNAGPMCTQTTNRHDFVPKPICPRIPFLPVSNTIMPRDGMEKDTVYKLSYLPNDMCNFQRTQAILPVNETYKSTAPMEHETTHTLSYLPVCPPKREPMPWAIKACYKRPTVPMECQTIQSMSYQPPGLFLNGSANCSCHKAHQMQYESHTFPKAAIVN